MTAGGAPGRPVPSCPRTRGLIQRVIDDVATPDDRLHGAACRSCGPVLLRAATFDDELRRIARRLVAEELPPGILDPDLSGMPRAAARRAGPGLAGILAAAAIMVVAMSVALLPGGLVGPARSPDGTGGPGPTPGSSGPAATPGDTALQLPGPPLRQTSSIGGSLIGNDWSCRSGRPDATPGPSPGSVDHEGIVCTSPEALRLTSTVLATGETADDEVVEVSVRGELVIATESAVQEMAETMSKVAFLSVGDKLRAPAVGDWVLARLPDLAIQPGGDEAFGIFGDVRLTLRRSQEGAYLLLLQAQPRG